MRSLRITSVLLCCLAFFPAATQAATSGFTHCPAGLSGEYVPTFNPQSDEESPELSLKDEKLQFLPIAVKKIGPYKGTLAYNFVWGTRGPQGPPIEILVCGVKLHTGLSSNVAALIIIAAFLLGAFLVWIILRPPSRKQGSQTAILHPLRPSR